MSRLRPISRLFALGIGTATCAGIACSRRMPVRFDALEPASVPWAAEQRAAPPARSSYSFQIVEQLSRGSIYGFGAGIVTAFFSRTLVFLGGLVVGSLQIASSMGLDVLGLISIDKKALTRSPVFSIWVGKPWFTSSFLLTFILAAFVRL